MNNELRAKLHPIRVHYTVLCTYIYPAPARTNNAGKVVQCAMTQIFWSTFLMLKAVCVDLQLRLLYPCHDSFQSIMKDNSSDLTL
eukprot:scaffold3044_cov176-Ochromonas_danica.AAC.7